jgi:hypothetical protein
VAAWEGRFCPLVIAALGGLAAPIMLVGGYFTARGGLAALWDAYIRYNMMYSVAGPGVRALTLAYGLSLMVSAVIGIAAFGGYTILAARPRGWTLPSAAVALRPLLLVAVPLDLLMTTLSGRMYLHYYVSWLPGMAVLAALFASGLLAHDAAPDRRERKAHGERVAPHLGGAVLVALLILGVACAYLSLPRQMAAAGTAATAAIEGDQRWNTRDALVAATADYVTQHTGPNDYVLVWGAETALNYAAQRPSPSRYSYQYPLFTRGYASDEMVHNFLSDLAQHPPVLIVDASEETPGGTIPPLDAAQRRRWMTSGAYDGPAGMQQVYAYIAAHYDRVAVIGENAWVIYRRTP